MTEREVSRKAGLARPPLAPLSRSCHSPYMVDPSGSHRRRPLSRSSRRPAEAIFPIVS